MARICICSDRPVTKFFRENICLEFPPHLAGGWNMPVAGFVVSQTRFGRHILALGSNLSGGTTLRHSDQPCVVDHIFNCWSNGSTFRHDHQFAGADSQWTVGHWAGTFGYCCRGFRRNGAFGWTSLQCWELCSGALLISMINNGLNLLNVPIFYQELTVGVLMLGAWPSISIRGFDVRSLITEAGMSMS